MTGKESKTYLRLVLDSVADELYEWRDSGEYLAIRSFACELNARLLALGEYPLMSHVADKNAGRLESMSIELKFPGED